MTPPPLPEAPSYEDKWFFPRLAGGEEQGLNEAGVETFKSTTSLGRETIQNIQDARSPTAVESNTPAIAEFELLNLPPATIPGHEMLLRVFNSCSDYLPKHFKKVEDQKSNGLDFLERGIEHLKSDSIPVLRIRDINTTGLKGFDTLDKGSPWWRLIRGQGWASSEGVGGGTYGIGQRAPFAFSDLRTVIYSTQLEDGSSAFIAKSILCSFPHPDHGNMTQNKGWYCRVTNSGPEPKWGPIHTPTDIPPSFRRSRTGTDLYITAYRDPAPWKLALRRSVLRNFFAAISGGSLEVHIRDSEEPVEKISKSTIDSLIQAEAKRRGGAGLESQGNMRRTHFFYRALTEPVAGRPATTIIPELGEVELYVHRDHRATSRVAYMRKPRILVEDKSNSSLSGYAAVFICRSDSGNAFLANMENPTHDKWHPDQARNWSNEEREKGHQALNSIRKWIGSELQRLNEQNQELEQEVIELADYLPAEDDDLDDDWKSGSGLETGKGQTGVETGQTIPRSTTLREIPQTNRIQPSPSLPENTLANDTTPEEKDGPGGEAPGPDHGDAPGNNEGFPDGDGTGGSGKKTGSGEGRTGDQSKHLDDPRRLSRADIDFRSFALSQDVYRLVLRAKKACAGTLALRALAEVGSDPIVITKINGAPSLDIASGEIQGLSLQADEHLTLDITIESDVKISIGVSK